MNRIQMLESDLHRARKAHDRARTGATRDRQAPAAAAPAAPAPAAAVRRTAAPVAGIRTEPDRAPTSVSSSVAAAMSAWMGTPVPARRRTRTRIDGGPPGRAARAMGLMLDYRVPNLPMPIRQKSTMVCWATVATMMASWRDQQSHGVDEYIKSLGEPWASKVAANEGLTPAQAPQLLATAGLQVESTQANFTSERWESMLRDFGPLWVTADNNSAPGVQGVHAHILVGIHGPSDGVPTVDIIDPASGTEVQMSMTDFVSRYEQLATGPFAGLQIRHWPAGAQRSAQASLAWARQASARMSQAAIGPAGVAAGAAVVGLGWQVFKDLVTSPAGLEWNRAELRGTRAPNDDPAKQGLATANPYQIRTLRSKHTLKYDFVVVADHVGAEFEVQYRYNGNCVRDVTITNTSYAPPGPLSGRNVRVETNIVPASEHERGDVVAVVVEIVYHFSNAGGSQGTFVDRFVLFGDGREEIRTTTET